MASNVKTTCCIVFWCIERINVVSFRRNCAQCYAGFLNPCQVRIQINREVEMRTTEFFRFTRFVQSQLLLTWQEAEKSRCSKRCVATELAILGICNGKSNKTNTDRDLVHHFSN